MAVMFHVLPTANRESIDASGLDWALMAAARGIAGSTRPELDGVFVCLDQRQVDYFLRLNNTGGPADVWEISGVDEDELSVTASGYTYLARRIPRRDLALVERSVDAAPAGMGLGLKMNRRLR